MKVFSLLVSLLLICMNAQCEETTRTDIPVDLEEFLVWQEQFETLDETFDANIIDAVEEYEKVLSSIGDDDFGGYFGGGKTPYLHVYLVEGKESCVPIIDNPYVVYHTVKYSKEYLKRQSDLIDGNLSKYHLILKGPLFESNCVILRVDQDYPEFVDIISSIQGLDKDVLYFELGSPMELF